MEIKEVLGVGKKFVIGMVHCLPLPGTARYNGDADRIFRQAVEDAQTLEESGVDAVIVENMGDTPFAVKLSTAQISALSVAVAKVREKITIPVGVDAAFNDYEASIAIAGINGCQFVRIPVFVDTVLFTDGIINPCARECLLYRKNMNAQNIMILGDVQVKHTRNLIPQDIEESAKNAADCGADAIIITGSTIGAETPLEMIARVKKAVKIPVIAGSGVNAKNINEQLNIADGAIIGSSLKKDGIITNPISGDLVRGVLQNLHR
ncbi:MAG: BtpA/SgcQ family protein [Spirochaetaceae bacterium]|jgi:membrane complex biogenesis BtpA family protein|nr:BtpA/SgcQ family protein [Spirochaetaceae bacterium]